ncbi:MAG: glutathione peroxidase, partial [Pseudomonadota bacterium]
MDSPDTAGAEPAAAEPILQTTNEADDMSSPTQFTSITGQPLSLSDYAGKAVLVVNTASKCGYTPQYEGLQALWTEYQGQGLVIVGVPSGDFGDQEFGEEAEIKAFCEINFGVDFPLTSRNVVTGDARHPFFALAEDALGEAAVPKWNFHKILLDTIGQPVDAFPSSVAPRDRAVVNAI